MNTRTCIRLAAVIFSLAACSGDHKDPVGPPTNTNVTASVEVDPTRLDLLVGATGQLSAVARNADGNAISRPITWTSSRPTVASVSSSGLVTALSLGQAVITASADGFAASALAVVDVPVTTATITVQNSLIYPVRIRVAGIDVGQVVAQSTASFVVTASSALAIDWTLVRPVLGARALGEPLAGSFIVNAPPRASRSVLIDNVVGGTYYFAPLVTNQTGVALLLVTNYRLQSEMRCDCVAPIGSARVQFGYYRLYTNSNVAAFRSGSNYTGGYVYFDNFGAGIPNGSGVREFTFTFAP